MLEVYVADGNIESALSLFRKKIEKDGILKLFTERTHGYLKPSVRLKLKHHRALCRINRSERRRERNGKTWGTGNY